MARFKFTDAAIRKIPAPETGQIDCFDDSRDAPAGFGIRIGKKRRTFFVMARVDGKPVRLTVGLFGAVSLESARQTARELKEECRKGNDPRQTAKAEKQARDDTRAKTFGAVCEEWLRRDQEGKGRRSAGLVRQAMANDFLKHSEWYDRPISAVTRADLLRKIDQIVDRGAPVHARRIFAYVHRMMAWAVGRGIVSENVLAGAEKPGAEISRDRVLTDAELVAFWNAAGGLGYPFSPIMRTLLLTGARRSEVAEIRWNELDLEGQTWTLPRERAKNNVAHTIPLSDLAVAVLSEGKRFSKSQYLFSGTGETPASGFSAAKGRLDQTMAEIIGAEIAGWRVHDLRRTFASNMQRIGTEPAVIEQLLNHKSGAIKGVAAVYQRHDYAMEKTQAMTAFAAWLRLLIADGKGDLWANIIKRFRRGADADKAELFATRLCELMAENPAFRDLFAWLCGQSDGLWGVAVRWVLKGDDMAKLAAGLRALVDMEIEDINEAGEAHRLISAVCGAEIIEIRGQA